MRKANIKGALVGVEAVTPEGLKRFQGLELLRRGAREQLQTFKAHGCMCLLIYLRAAYGQAGDLRRHRSHGAEGGGYVCAVCDDDAVSRHRGFYALGEGKAKNPTMVATCRLPVLDDSHRGSAKMFTRILR